MCESLWALVAIYGLMILGFIGIFAVPFYFLDRAYRRLQREGR